MGGGGAWRLGAKIAGVGVANSGLRSVTAEHQVSTAARKVITRPVSAVVTSSEDMNESVSVAAHSGKIDEAIQMPYWLDDWEFASIDESGEPRLVFGGAPTFQEAKEATSVLKDALKEVYLAPPHSIGCSGSYIDGQDSCLPLFSESEVLEFKKCVTSETHSVSQNAIGAFGFLNRSRAAQSVVASIACDPSVWNAVLRNEVLVDFLQANKINTDADAGFLNQQCLESSDESSDCEESDSESVDIYFLQSLRLTVVDMMSSLQGYLQTFFGGSVVKNGSTNADGSEETILVDDHLTASLMGLAVMVMVVIAMRRG